MLAAACIFCGSATGYVTAGMVGQQTETELKFDTTYSNAAVQAVQEEEEKEAREETEEETGKAEATVESRKTVGEKKPPVSLAVGSGVILFILTVLISAGYMKATLKKEMLQMLGESEEI